MEDNNIVSASESCFMVMPEKCLGINKWGAQSLLDSEHKVIP